MTDDRDMHIFLPLLKGSSPSTCVPVQSLTEGLVQDHQTHYEAVGTLGNLVHSSPEIKRIVLSQGVLQPVINLLQCSCRDSLREAALLIGQFAQQDNRSRQRQNREVLP